MSTKKKNILLSVKDDVVSHLLLKYIKLLYVEICPSFLLSIQVYKMRSRPKGRVLIININNFNQKLPARDGSSADYANLQKLFKDMNFTVVKSEAELTDLTAEVSKIKTTKNCAFLKRLNAKNTDIIDW